MNNLINNFYVSRFLFITLIILFSISVIDTMKNKHSVNIKDKINLKRIDLNFLIRIISLSFVLKIMSEQLIYSFWLEEPTSSITLNFSTILVESITTCLVAPIFEEIIFRFGLYEYLNKKIKSSIIVILLTSILFSIIHFYRIDGFIILLIISSIWNYSYFKTNNLTYPIIMHFVYNVSVMISYIEINNVFDILFGVICLIIYLLSKFKSSSKNTTA